MRTLMGLLIAHEGRPMLTIDELASLRSKSVRTLQNEISAGRAPVPMWKDGGTWCCHASDVAAWMDRERDAAIRKDPELYASFLAAK